MESRWQRWVGKRDLINAGLGFRIDVTTVQAGGGSWEGREEMNGGEWSHLEKHKCKEELF